MSATTDRPRFPDGFVDLEPFRAWALPGEAARSRRRRDSDLAEIKAFYGAMLPRVPDILAYLQEFPLQALSEPQRHLLDLCLAFAEIAPFVEQYRRTVLPEIFDEERFIQIHETVGADKGL